MNYNISVEIADRAKNKLGMGMEGLESFYRKINKLSSDCWIWRGFMDGDGYGRASAGSGRMMGAHRISYILFKGDIAPNLCVCHSCDNPRCVNPEHLWLGSNAENTRDKVSKKRSVMGEKQHDSKLKLFQVNEIRKFYAENKQKHHWGARKLAKKYGVDMQTIQRVAHNRSWKNS